MQFIKRMKSLSSGMHTFSEFAIIILSEEKNIEIDFF